MMLLGHILDHVLDHIIIGLMTTTLQFHDHWFYDHGITIAFFFGVSFDKPVIVKKKFAIR